MKIIALNSLYNTIFKIEPSLIMRLTPSDTNEIEFLDLQLEMTKEQAFQLKKELTRLHGRIQSHRGHRGHSS